MSRYLDPKADVVFKKVFGEHPHLLKSFLNAVLPLSSDQEIVSLTYLPVEQTPKIPILKHTIADVKCTDALGRVFIVEMQIEWTDNFKQRLLFEAGQAFVKQLKRGEDYKLLQPVYGLALLATTFDDATQWYHHYQLVNIGKPMREIIEHLQLVFIELPKFPVHSPEEKKLRLLWLRFMREVTEKTTTVSPELTEIPEINEALTLTEEAAYNPAELDAYESYWKAVSSEKTLANARYVEGRAEGRSEGLAEGLAKGHSEGLTEGLKKAARNMLAKGISVSTVAELTGLSEETIRAQQGEK